MTPDTRGAQGNDGFAGKIGWGRRPALLLVDVCNAYWSATSPLDTRSNPASAAAPASIAKLVAAARQGKTGKTRLFWTRVEYTEPDMADAGLFYTKVPLLKLFQTGCQTDDGLGDWMPGLEPAADELVITKRYPSAFFATDLASRLRSLNIDTLVICGVSTSGCVRATALDAMCLGFRPMVVGQACGDRSPAVHDASMFDMNAKMADVVSEEEAVEKLRAGWQ
ncbi:N-carbamoylsarcosine amidase [Pyrenophora tritici-repentis]|nr:N-carbamoylsarcosine amidase [Pyrenophora tritici-repentis Pt-1C-BFP]KAA8622453.1 N-carbamoylsarcosine amidase [Pyrenophora tritici-repentis]EDU44368.1 N-carbamoylsarcosine amidase [Pyrenophora tritici-repentis Pt-1C-BFP]KAF7451436.1 hypothetical protein A1F99_032130 [Pyrenophora tritici-repentis]KAF7575455.1 N-carbamoylsarcosine amidase [Pyrenophora tritici-repentis]KAI0582185.1 N-carbamoylsarcosine amidase [Pyrenophora tritici-repentis]